MVANSSKYTIGAAALQQLINSSNIPIGLFLKKLSQTDKIFNIQLGITCCIFIDIAFSPPYRT